jgi:hypothetical protein
MRVWFSLTVLLFVLTMSSCNNQKIVLDRVNFLPDYFTGTYHFGRDIKSIEEQNEYLLVTGKIDTTSETPPIKQGVIAIDKKKIYLDLIKSISINDMTFEEYSGNGYTLKLTYKKNNSELSSEGFPGTLTVRHGNFSSEYKIVGESGFQ